MPRKLRKEYPGAFYHVMCRGNNGEYILTEEKSEYVRLMEKYKERYRFRIYAYCIMDNHVHILLETADIPLSKIMQGIQQSFTQYYNKKYKRTGHIFQQRYKAQLCDKERYLWQLVKYIHINPIKAGIKQGLEYKWSSHNTYISGENDSLVEASFILRMISDNPIVAQEGYRKFMNMEFDNDSLEDFQAIIESDDRLKYSMNESKKATLEVIINEVCKQAEMSLENIVQRTKIKKYSDARKAIVRLTKMHSVISNKEIAEALNIPPSMISKILSGESRGTHLVDDLICKIEEKGIFQA